MKPRRISLAAVVVIALIASACAGRDALLSRTIAGVNAGRDAFVPYDAAKQAAIVDAAPSHDAGAAALADYRKARRPVELAMVAAYGAIAVASVDLSEAALTSAAKAAADFISALRALGVLR